MPAPKRYRRPVRLEAEFAVRISKAIDIVGGGKIRLAIDPALGLEFRERAPTGFLQRGVDQLARRHAKARMFRAQPFRQTTNDLVIGPAFAGRIDQLRPEQEVLTAARGVKIVVFDEHGRGQHDVGHFAVSVMNCSCTQTNKSSRAKPRLTTSWSGATATGLVFWISMALTGGPPRSASSSPVRIWPMRD